MIQTHWSGWIADFGRSVFIYITFILHVLLAVLFESDLRSINFLLGQATYIFFASFGLVQCPVPDFPSLIGRVPSFTSHRIILVMMNNAESSGHGHVSSRPGDEKLDVHLAFSLPSCC